MSNIIPATQATEIAAPSDIQMMNALRDSFYPGAKLESVAMVLNYCRAADLDPMTKPVHIVPMSVKKPGGQGYEWRDVVMPGIELYRIKADRTGRYAGQDDAEFGPEIERWGIAFPQWCKVTVYKLTDIGRVAYSAKVFWLESYATAGRDSDGPNAMWRKRPYGQLEKCAEAAALRKAFPEIGAQPTADEMYGKAIEPPERPVTATVVDEPTDEQPATRTAAVKSKLRARRQTAEPDAPTLAQVTARLEAAESEADLGHVAELAAKLADPEDKAMAREAFAAKLRAIRAAAEGEQAQAEIQEAEPAQGDAGAEDF